jgi:hypothetical protein
MIQAYKRCVADGVNDGIVDLAHKMFSLKDWCREFLDQELFFVQINLGMC